ncbi:hypothetical protein EDD18DRAFT_1364057 [Armillaria luteobubalina]|uniref:Uncharacterized protein n=1 Tax=Armillaria luteobubalina TaxID=153913 RepID=A0AA39P988_9AGAR|nr:hypothetical protein EDD18DRAFT_1364057 [Armillaria luteobubalina]
MSSKALKCPNLPNYPPNSVLRVYTIPRNKEMSSALQSVDDDVLGAICALLEEYELKQISLVDKRLREASLPLLFQRVCMRFVYNTENVWKSAMDAVEDLLASTALDIVVRNTRFLDIHISEHPSEDCGEDSMPSVLPERLAKLLSAPFRQLRTLVFSIDERKAQTFGNQFRMAGIELHTVTVLFVGAYCDFMVPLCPNVEHVATCDWVWLTSNRGGASREHSFRLIAAAGGAKMLRHFEMNEWWSADLLNAVYDAMPCIEMLTLDGGRVRDSIKLLLPILSQFKKLKTLGLVHASFLGVGFDPPWSGNVYAGPGGVELLRRVQVEMEAANRCVADMVFGACINLDVMTLGDTARAVVIRGDGGQIQDIRWCKTQRRPTRSFDVPSLFSSFHR